MQESNLPIVSKACKSYIIELLGENIAKCYFNALSKPVEDYSFHLLFDISRKNEVLDILHANDFETKTHKLFDDIILIRPKGPFSLTDEGIQKVIVVDKRAAEMVYQGSDIFAPGVKRANKVRRGDLTWIITEKGIKVAKGLALMSDSEILAIRKGIAARNLLSPYITPSIEKLGLNSYSIIAQSIPAYLTSLNLMPKPKDKVLDCCAAPGNKTIHISKLTENKANILAVDRSSKRLKKLKDRIKQYKLKNIKVQAADIIKLSQEITVKFDKILIDPPCTGLGLRPKIHLECSKSYAANISRYQRAILFACDKLLKKGGTIIYSTCTITSEENEDVVKFAIEKLNYKVVEQDFVLGDIRTLNRENEFYIQRFIPGIHETPGYCITKLKKV